MSKVTLKCVCAAINSNGEPDFFFHRVRCTEAQYEDGAHYTAAEAETVEHGAEALVCFDERDTAFSAFRCNAFVWHSAPIIDISEKVMESPAVLA